VGLISEVAAMASNGKSQPDCSPGLKALATPVPEPTKKPEPEKTPNYSASAGRMPDSLYVIRFVFVCRCGKAFPIEEGFQVRTALSEAHVQELLATFVKTVEPRTITCSCGHEAEYSQKDVKADPLEEPPKL
jgi:hypothetical protein